VTDSMSSGRTDDLAAKGAAVQMQLWGPGVASTDRPALPAAQLAPDFFAMVREFCFGMFWSREQLAIRDRSLITISLLAALNRQDELRGHIAGGLNVGLTRDEIIEALMHVGVYAGVPAAVSALGTAASVLGTGD
jgi:4-carboxymuconolactone decarboxylase